MYVDRRDAGRALAKQLRTLLGDGPAVVLALPRGGVPVAAEVTRCLHLPLDLCYVRKIGAPDQPELAIGAVADGPEPRVVLNRDLIATLGVPQAYVAQTTNRKLAEIDRQRARYQPDHTPVEIAGHTVILVDDELATGTTARAALRSVRAAEARRLVLAVPVGPADTLGALAAEADLIICPVRPDPFIAVGHHYRQFPQVTDEEVIAELSACSAGAHQPRSDSEVMSGHAV